jgi:hypothetical protein
MSTFRPGDFVKVESYDDADQIVFGRLDSVPLLDYGGKLKPGSEVAISIDRIREHKKASEFR